MNSQNSSELKRTDDCLASPDERIESRQCEKHGTYEARLRKVFGTEIGGRCPECDREMYEARARESARQEQIQRDLKVKDLLYRSGISARHRGKRFEGFDAKSPAQRSALTIAQRYAEAIVSDTGTRGASLLLVGPPGGGKTHLATAIAEEVARGLKSVRYVPCSELTRRVRATFAHGARETESDVYDELTECRLLILDELAATSLSEHERKVLFEIVDTRYRELLPMVLVSNQPLEELSPIVGERIVDRLREMATTVAFNWPSHRSKSLQRAA